MVVTSPTRKEFYIAFMNERSMNGPCCIASSEGGVNIEEVGLAPPTSPPPPPLISPSPSIEGVRAPSYSSSPSPQQLASSPAFNIHHFFTNFPSSTPSQVAEKNPDAIVKFPIDPLDGLSQVRLLIACFASTPGFLF